ncbi:MAG: haloacid dehalogenase-like hydrolase [Candidatus Micrarchaeota archaeon]
MSIKLIAFDFDGVIPVEESPLFLFEQLGKKQESDALAREFYSGLAGAKNAKERDLVPGKVWEKSFALYQQFPIRKLRETSRKLQYISGSKEIFNYCRENGIITAILSATIKPILAWSLSSRNISPDALIASECTIKEGRLHKLTKVVSPETKRRELESLLRSNKFKPAECLVVGDSFSEVPMFEFVGKENSVAFNYQQDLGPHCGHLLFKQGDPERDLRKIIDVIENKK